MATSPTSLDSAFLARAIPQGSARHWSYVFASVPVRAPLLGVYALLAEWLALLDPATERSVAQLKIAWWQDEMSRLAQGTAVHPISRFLASQPTADPAHFTLLREAAEAAMAQIGGVPLERGVELEAHSSALLAGPLRVVSLIAAEPPDMQALERCTKSLAMAQYLARALREYRRDARSGRVPFAVDELLRAGVENGDLSMPDAPPRLQMYLESLRRKADACYSEAAAGMPATAQATLRHLLVLAALGRKHLHTAGGSSAFGALKDMLLAWSTARRAGQRIRS